MMPLTLASIRIYPVKSLGGFSLPQVRLTDRGLEHDRRWMLIDEQGRFLSQREVPAMAVLHCAPTEAGFTVTDARNGSVIHMPWTQQEGERITARVWDDEVDLISGDRSLAQWFSDALQRRVRMAYMPDSTVRATDPRYAKARVALNDAFPALLISQASLDELNSRLQVPVSMDRFRPNLVIAGGNAFQEDLWASLTIGTARFRIVKPCARCVIITTDQQTGERSAEPLRTLAGYRSVGKKVRFGMLAVHEGKGLLQTGTPVHSDA